MAVPTKYASCRVVHGGSSVWPANEARGWSRASSTAPSSLTMATRSGVKELCRSLLVQTRRDHDVVEDSRLPLERPERAALGQARSNAVELIPACQTTMG